MPTTQFDAYTDFGTPLTIGHRERKIGGVYPDDPNDLGTVRDAAVAFATHFGAPVTITEHGRRIRVVSVTIEWHDDEEDLHGPADHDPTYID